MRILSKINRGVILTVVVLLGVAAYLIGLEVAHSSARKEIRQACEEYVATELKYHMLPEAYRSEKSDMPQAELDDYIAAMRQELKAFYVDNEQTYRYAFDNLEAELTAQSKGEGVVYQFKKEIVQYEIEFSGNTASVVLTSVTTYEGPVDSDAGKLATGVSSRQTVTGETTDRLSFQRTDGEWKLTYAALGKPGSAGASIQYAY